jgi:hypothetical protein
MLAAVVMTLVSTAGARPVQDSGTLHWQEKNLRGLLDCHCRGAAFDGFAQVVEEEAVEELPQFAELGLGEL